MKKSTTVYGVKGCPWSERVNDILEDHKVKFKFHDIKVDAKAKEDLVKRTGQYSVPVTIIDEHTIVGFDHESIIKSLL
jgi:glutaredoxin